MREAIEEHTQKNSSGSNTLHYIQILDQLYAHCRQPIDNTTKLTQLSRGLRRDLQVATMLQPSGEPWTEYESLRAHLLMIAPAYDKRSADRQVSRADSRSAKSGRNTASTSHLTGVKRGASLTFDSDGLPNISAFKQGRMGQAKGAQPAAGGHHPSVWATNPATQKKRTFNPLLTEEQWQTCTDKGRCWTCYKPYFRGHQCAAGDTGKKPPSIEVTLGFPVSMNRYSVLQEMADAADVEQSEQSAAFAEKQAESNPKFTADVDSELTDGSAEPVQPDSAAVPSKTQSAMESEVFSDVQPEPVPRAAVLAAALVVSQHVLPVTVES